MMRRYVLSRVGRRCQVQCWLFVEKVDDRRSLVVRQRGPYVVLGRGSRRCLEGDVYRVRALVPLAKLGSRKLRMVDSVDLGGGSSESGCKSGQEARSRN